MGKHNGWTSTYPVNVSGACNVVDGDEEMLTDLFDIFLEHVPEQLKQLEKAVDNRNGENIQFYAHQIKGAMRNFAAETACTAAYQLEKAGKTGDFTNIQPLFADLQREIEVVKKYIEKKEWKKYFKV